MKTSAKGSLPAAKRTVKAAAPAGKKGATPPPELPRLRLRLVSVDDVRKELARLYRDTKAKRVDTQDASRMANMLAILARLIEGADFEARLEAVERATQTDRNRNGGARWDTRH